MNKDKESDAQNIKDAGYNAAVLHQGLVTELISAIYGAIMNRFETANLPVATHNNMILSPEFNLATSMALQQVYLLILEEQIKEEFVLINKIHEEEKAP